MPGWLTLTIAVVAVIAIFATTTAGQRMVAGLGLDALVKNGAPKQDREFLLRACDGDAVELERLLGAERSRNPAMTEAQVYRRAIRTYMNSRDTSDA
jgi:hypothetical protein